MQHSQDYKRRSVNLTVGGRQLRAHRRSIDRKSWRDDVFMKHRVMSNESLAGETKPLRNFPKRKFLTPLKEAKENSIVHPNSAQLGACDEEKPKKLSAAELRRIQLVKYKERKQLLKELDKKTKPTFKVCQIKYSHDPFAALPQTKKAGKASVPSDKRVTRSMIKSGTVKEKVEMKTDTKPCNAASTKTTAKPVAAKRPMNQIPKKIEPVSKVARKSFAPDGFKFCAPENLKQPSPKAEPKKGTFTFSSEQPLTTELVSEECPTKEVNGDEKVVSIKSPKPSICPENKNVKNIKQDIESDSDLELTELDGGTPNPSGIFVSPFVNLERGSSGRKKKSVSKIVHEISSFMSVQDAIETEAMDDDKTQNSTDEITPFVSVKDAIETEATQNPTVKITPPEEENKAIVLDVITSKAEEPEDPIETEAMNGDKTQNSTDKITPSEEENKDTVLDVITSKAEEPEDAIETEVMNDDKIQNSTDKITPSEEETKDTVLDIITSKAEEPEHAIETEVMNDDKIQNSTDKITPSDEQNKDTVLDVITSKADEPSVENLPSKLQELGRFKQLLVDHTDSFRSKIDKWTPVKTEDLPESAANEIDVANGMAELLMNQRFKQFEDLIADCEFGRGEKEVTCDDLLGFWEMIYHQVENVEKKFNALDQLKEKNWKTQTPKQKKRKKRNVNATPRAKAKPITSRVRDHIEAARKRNQNKSKSPGIEIATAEPKEANDDATPVDKSLRRSKRKISMSHLLVPTASESVLSTPDESASAGCSSSTSWRTDTPSKSSSVSRREGSISYLLVPTPRKDTSDDELALRLNSDSPIENTRRSRKRSSISHLLRPTPKKSEIDDEVFTQEDDKENGVERSLRSALKSSSSTSKTSDSSNETSSAIKPRRSVRFAFDIKNDKETPSFRSTPYRAHRKSLKSSTSSSSPNLTLNLTDSFSTPDGCLDSNCTQDLLSLTLSSSPSPSLKKVNRKASLLPLGNVSSISPGQGDLMCFSPPETNRRVTRSSLTKKF